METRLPSHLRIRDCGRSHGRSLLRLSPQRAVDSYSIEVKSTSRKIIAICCAKYPDMAQKYLSSPPPIENPLAPLPLGAQADQHGRAAERSPLPCLPRSPRSPRNPSSARRHGPASARSRAARGFPSRWSPTCTAARSSRSTRPLSRTSTRSSSPAPFATSVFVAASPHPQDPFARAKTPSTSDSRCRRPSSRRSPAPWTYTSPAAST